MPMLAMAPMLLRAGLGCTPALPEAFDYHIDRTLVPGMRLSPVSAPSGVPRAIDALVLSPYEVRSVRVEVCGLRTDIPVGLYDAACFAEPTLIEELSDSLPFVWDPPDITFECDPATLYGSNTYYYGEYGYYGYGDSGDSGGSGSGVYIPYPCGVNVPVRVAAVSDQDEGSSFVPVNLNGDWTRDVRDPALADPRLEVVEGTAQAGGSVKIRFSLDPKWFRGGPSLYSSFRWWVDAGELLGTGRTGTTGLGDDDRPYSDNTLRIPDDVHGPLRVAVVYNEEGPAVWVVRTLEVE